jgi:hypothetical protein
MYKYLHTSINFSLPVTLYFYVVSYQLLNKEINFFQFFSNYELKQAWAAAACLRVQGRLTTINLSRAASRLMLSIECRGERRSRSKRLSSNQKALGTKYSKEPSQQWLTPETGDPPLTPKILFA